VSFSARQGLTYVEIGVETCPLVYGTDPCEAAVGVTGDTRCFNTRATCQDALNFALQDHPEGVATYVAASEASSPGSATVTFSAMSIGAVAGEGDTRSVAVGVTAWRSAGAVSLTSATIGGVAATIVKTQASGGILAALIWAEVPTGTTADVVCVFSAQPSEAAATTHRLLNAEPSDQSGSSATAPAPSTTAIDAAADCSVIGVVASYLMSTTSWSGLTERVDDVVTSLRYSVADLGFAAADDALTVTATQTYAARTAPTLQATFAGPRADSGAYVQFTGLATGDLLLVAIARAGGTSGSTPTDWTLLFTADNNGARIDLYRRTALWSGGTTLNVEFDSNLRDYGVGLVVRGVSDVAFIRQTEATSGTSTTSPVAPGATTDIDNTLVIDIISRLTDISGAQFSAWTNSDLSSYGENFDNGTTNGSGSGIAVASGLKAAAGAVGSSSATLANASAYVGIKLGIAPTDNSDSKIALAAASFEWTRPTRTDVETVLRFAKASDYRPVGIEAIPNIVAVDFTPATIAPGEDLGTRAVLRVTFKDHPYSDTGDGFDPYYSTRSYDPYQQGSFWPKFRARQPYLRGEPLTWYQGFLGQELSEMETRHFVVESFDGPTPDGSYTIIAYDALKMLDGDRAQCPVMSQGRLSADVLVGASSLTVTPSGIGEDYPASGHVAIGGKEIVSFTRSGDTFTITRGQKNTTAAAHTAGDRVQLVKTFDSMDPADIIAELMEDYASVPAAWIPLADWQAETGAYLRRNFTADIAEPVGVQQLVAELMQQAGLSLWWDDEEEQVRLRVLRPIATDAALYDETLYRQGTIGIREQPDKRVSQVWVSFGQINPLKSIEDRDNYRSTLVEIDADAELNYGQSKIKKIYSRWIAQGGRTAAERVAGLHLSRYATPPRLLNFGLFRGAQTTPRLGDGCQVSHRVLQDATGARVQLPGQIVSCRPMLDGFTLNVEEFNFGTLGEEDLADRQITIDANSYSLDLRALHDDLYPDPRTGDTVTFVIEQHVVVGSDSTSTPAVDVGTWPTQAATGNRTSGSAVISSLSIDTALLAVGLRVSGTGIPAGATIATIDSSSQITLSANASSSGTGGALTFALVNVVVINRGTISGRGGDGGTGRSEGSDDPPSGERNGGPGGTGLYCRYLITYTDTDARTQGGGGGGAGGSCADLGGHRGGGGGGGAGFPAGAGGIGPGNGEDGQAGTLTEGGAYGRSYTSSTFWSAPSLKDGVHGGDGGDAGTAGDDDAGGYDLAGGSPGAAGTAIDGISYITASGATGTRAGAQVN